MTKIASETKCTIVVVGDSRTGKSALLHRFVHKSFQPVRHILLLSFKYVVLTIDIFFDNQLLRLDRLKQWCRKVKNFGGASANGNLATPGWNRVNWSAKYGGEGPVAPSAPPVPAPLSSKEVSEAPSLVNFLKTTLWSNGAVLVLFVFFFVWFIHT